MEPQRGSFSLDLACAAALGSRAAALGSVPAALGSVPAALDAMAAALGAMAAAATFGVFGRLEIVNFNIFL
jgi:hypothetical protein